MERKDLFEKSLGIHRAFAKRFHKYIKLVDRNNTIETQPMAIDEFDSDCQYNRYRHYCDYTRYRTFELCVKEILKMYNHDELKSFSVAEAGVFRGDFSWIINDYFNMCELYLYDTFEGFNTGDVSVELGNRYTTESYMNKVSDYFGDTTESSGDRILAVKSKLKKTENVVIRKGYFPETAAEEKDKQWIFVSLDMDLYKPIYEGVTFFYPGLVEGGYIFVHDYNNKEFAGVEKAIKDAENTLGTRIIKFPLCDEGGTVVLMKEMT